MSTRGAMITEMASDMERSDSVAFQNKITAAIRHYQGRRFWFNESRDVTFNLVAGTDTYSSADVGAKFYSIAGVFVTISANDVREMAPKSYADIEVLADEDTSTGEPGIYARIGGSLRFWRSPDDTYSCRVLGHQQIDAPESDDEADNPWMVSAYDLIMCRAKAELYAHRYEDPSNAMVMREAEASALRALLNDTHDETALGHLEATDF